MCNSQPSPGDDNLEIGVYGFELKNSSYGSEKKVKADLAVFLNRLDLNIPRQDGDKVTTGEDSASFKLLRQFVVANHRAADWYDQARAKRRRSYNRYAWGRIILLTLIPVGMFMLSGYTGSEREVTQVTVLLTGLMAAYRASNQWVEAKFAASNFGKAASALKENVYAIEAQWAGVRPKMDGDRLCPEFELALNQGILQAREIVRKQRDDYFAASAPPTVDIMDTLTKSRTDVIALLKQFQSPKMTETLKQEAEAKVKSLAMDTLQNDVAKLTATLAAQNDLIASKESEKVSADATRKKSLDALILALSDARNQMEKTLLEKSVALTVLMET